MLTQSTVCTSLAAHIHSTEFTTLPKAWTSIGSAMEDIVFVPHYPDFDTILLEVDAAQESL